MGLEGVSNGFERFEDVGVVVENALEFPFLEAGRDFEVLDTGRFDLRLFDTDRNGDGSG